jgi:hypothetical protein
MTMEVPGYLHFSNSAYGYHYYRKANTGTVWDPAEDNDKQVVFLTRGSKELDKKGKLASVLFNVQVVEVEATERRVQENDFG